MSLSCQCVCGGSHGRLGAQRLRGLCARTDGGGKQNLV